MLGHVEDELYLLHDVEQLFLGHHESIELDLAHFLFLARFAELKLAYAKACQH